MLQLSDRWGRDADNCDWWGHPEWSQRPTLILFWMFFCLFLACVSEIDRNMCLYASIRVWSYIMAVTFTSPLAAEDPKPQALPSPLLCNSCPKAIKHGACQTGPLLWNSAWLVHTQTHTHTCIGGIPFHTQYSNTQDSQILCGENHKQKRDE